jgi:hypothetical protein
VSILAWLFAPITDAEVEQFGEAMSAPAPSVSREPRKEWARVPGESWEAWLKRSARHQAGK